MNINDLKHFPRRVWINNPSRLQPHHKLHAKVGIAVYNPKSESVTIYFTEGKLISMVIDVRHIELKNS